MISGVRPAHELLGRSDLSKMLKGKWRFGNIADVVRFRGAAAENVGAGAGCWVIDLDTVWVQTPTAKLASVSGSRFATCAAPPRTSGDRRYWKWRYLQRPEERSYALPPMYFAGNAVLDKVLDEFDNISAWGARPYTYFLNRVEDHAIALGHGGHGGDFQEVSQTV